MSDDITGCLRQCMAVGLLWMLAAPSGAVAAGDGVSGPELAPTETFNYDRFGAVVVYRGHGHPRDVVLLMSGDAGWDKGAAALAQRLVDKGAVVAGIDTKHYREQLETVTESCASPASDFENLSHYLQSKLGLKKYLEPTLVGYGSGAGLAHATLAGAPEGLFKGALGIGYCPDFGLKKPLCETDSKRLPGPWVALKGEPDAVCPAGTDYVLSPAVMPHVDAAYAQMSAIRSQLKSAALPAAVADLPLIVVPVAPGSRGDWFSIFLTGDGGWVGLDKGVSSELAKHDIPVVGWDSLKYFWQKRTPDGASHDLDRVVRTYSRAWGRSHVLLIGYSQGADTMPFMINRLPPDTHRLVGYTTLLGISDNAVWEFHVASWLGSPTKGIPTAPELAHWTGSPYLCLYGESDEDTACQQLTGHDGTAVKLTGGHHFGGEYTEIADAILSRLPGS